MGGPLNIDGATATRLTWNKAEVAHALGCSAPTFDKKRLELEQRFGFPKKIPGINAWSIAAVSDWTAHAGGYTPFNERITGPAGAAMVELELEYGGDA